LGKPVIRTLGSPEGDCSGYNPPEICRAIVARLREVDPRAWEEHIPFRRELFRRAIPGMTDGEIAECVADELSIATGKFPVLLSTYTNAVEKGFGVSCEYSL